MKKFLSKLDCGPNPAHLYYWNDKTGRVTEEYRWPDGRVDPGRLTLGQVSTEEEAEELVRRTITGEGIYDIPANPKDLIKMLRARILRGVLPKLGKLTMKGPVTMYHSTLLSYLPKIIQEGLQPGVQSTFFKEGITSYAPVLWLSETEDNVYEYLTSIEDKELPSNKFVILKVEIPPYVTLFKDPFQDEDVMWGSWITYDGIPPQGIRIVGYATFKEEWDVSRESGYDVRWLE